MSKIKQKWLNKFDEAETNKCFCFVVFKINQYPWNEGENIFCYCSSKNDIFNLFDIIEARFGEYMGPRINYKATIDVLYVGPGTRLIPIISYRWLWPKSSTEMVIRYQTLFQGNVGMWLFPIVNQEIIRSTNDFNCYMDLGSIRYFMFDQASEFRERSIKVDESPKASNNKIYLEDYQYTEETRPPWLKTYQSYQEELRLERESYLEDNEYYDDGGGV